MKKRSISTALPLLLILLILLGSRNIRGAEFCVDNVILSLQDALDAADSNSEEDVIQIVQGTHSGNFSFSSSSGHDITIRGGYLKNGGGCYFPVPTPSASQTILDGKDSGRVLDILNGKGRVVVKQLTMKNGYSTLDGAGIYIYSSVTVGPGQPGSIKLEDNIIEDNHADRNGGGVYTRSYSNVGNSNELLFTDNIVRNNTSSQMGGGVFAMSDTPLGQSGLIQLIGNTITDNTADWGGGGVIVDSYGETGNAQIVVRNNIISGNRSYAHGIGNGNSGGIYIESDTPNSTILGDVEMSNNIIADNHAEGLGGGFYARLKNAADSGNLTLTHNTITGNHADSEGGGVAYRSNQLMRLYNNIIWGNSAQLQGDDIFFEPWSTATAHYNDYADVHGTWQSESNNINVNPRFIGSGDYHLQTFSPCRDKGTASAPTLPASDIDGDNRTIGKAPDLGADELVLLFHWPMFMPAVRGGVQE